MEGDILHGILRNATGRGTDTTPHRVEVASRTDRGVSASGNALALQSELAGPLLLRQLNGICPELFFTAATPIPEEFRVRSALRRTYRYWEPGPVGELGPWRKAASRFRGATDVRSFGRSIPAQSPQWRTVDRVEISPVDGGLLIEVRAPSFVWGMVRKIVGALREHARGRLPLSRLEAAIDGELRLTLPMAEPEPLVLWEVEYPIPWTVFWGGPNRHQRAYAEAALRSARVREHVLAALRAAPPGKHLLSVE